MKREYIRGKTLRFSKYFIEYVSINHIPHSIVISDYTGKELFRLGGK